MIYSPEYGYYGMVGVIELTSGLLLVSWWERNVVAGVCWKVKRSGSGSGSGSGKGDSSYFYHIRTKRWETMRIDQVGRG